MTINISLPEGQKNLRPRITVVGVGGAGGNAVNNMISSNLEGVDFMVANTDAQALDNSSCDKKVQLGLNSTKGLGAGMRPDVGKTAAEEAHQDIESKLSGSNMAFIAAGMGGGTGTGAAPVIAKLARENGILTVGVVTKPFHFEGMQRMRLADQGIEELEQYVDTLIIIPNQNLFRIANEKTTFSDAFKMADDVLYAGVRGVTDLMVMPGLINLDFSDVKTVMSEMGKAMMGTGEAQGENRAVGAAEAAIANPIIDDVSLKGAKGLIINITGGKDLTLYEVDEAANRIREEVDVDANIIFGSTCDDRLEGVMRVSIVATGIESNTGIRQKKVSEAQTIRINNSVYKKPIPQVENTNINFNSYSTAISKSNNIEKEEVKADDSSQLQNYTENHNETSSEKIEENLEIEDNIKVENELLDNEKVQKHSVLEEEKEVINDEVDLKDPQDLETVNTLENDNTLGNSNTSENNNALENAINIAEETNSRRVSLFDNIDSKKTDISNDKKEPFLGYLKEESESEDNNNIENNTLDKDFNQDIVDETNNYEDNIADEEVQNEYDKDEELLDIPTFLRRQAN